MDIRNYYKQFNNIDFLNEIFNYAKEHSFSGFLIPLHNEPLIQHIEVKFLYYLRAVYIFYGGNFCGSGNGVK